MMNQTEGWQLTQPRIDGDKSHEPAATVALDDYPVREYIAGLSRELAQMARDDGDEGLGVLLDAAAERAAVAGRA